MNDRYTDKQLAKRYGRQGKGTCIFFPQEYGYRCPKGHHNLYWSEFKKHIWCYKCKKDYHYAFDCIMIKDRFNPKDLPKQPRIIIGIKNMDKTGNLFTMIPKRLLK